MRNLNLIFGTTLATILLASMISYNPSFAEQQLSETEIIPIDSTIGLEKTTVSMNVPENNALPWAFVEGKINHHVPDYPVIIQIFDSDDQIEGNNIGAVHFAQTSVNDDGSYEYKFRVLDYDGDNKINIFEGNYTVKIFKVVYLNSDLTSV